MFQFGLCGETTRATGLCNSDKYVIHGSQIFEQNSISLNLY